MTMDEERLTITALQPRRGQQYQMTLSDGTEVMVDRRTMDESPYRVDSALTTEQLSALLSLSEKNRAREKSLWLLSHRDYSRRELTRKLSTTTNREVAAETAARMEEIGLVDDEKYARKWARELCFVRHYPSRRAVGKLIEKGVSREMAEGAVEEACPDDVASALAFLHKKCYNVSQDETSRQKMMGALLRYGFDGETARTALRRFEQEDEEPLSSRLRS